MVVSSYIDQKKDEAWRTAEGESFFIDLKHSVIDIIKDIEGGLRSALTYVGANSLKDFQNKALLMEVSSNTIIENGAHGKND